ncbi:phage baseplate assembly protein V [Vreelandella venusta]|uniref:phage baseplate assembly protein V n=1 Tax=Vreelandella venusta TaxID=44935 RepID=UPI00384A657D
MNNAAELLRLIENLLRFGAIAEVDHGAPGERLPAVRVRSGALLTGWLPWAGGRAGTTRDWNPPTVGEQVMILSPGGDLANAVVMPSLFQLSAQPPSNDPSKISREFPDGGLFEYDHETQVFRINLPNRLEIVAPGGTQWLGDISHQGDMQREGSYAQEGGSHTHNGKNTGSDHKHGGIQPGPGNTGEPI